MAGKSIKFTIASKVVVFIRRNEIKILELNGGEYPIFTRFAGLTVHEHQIQNELIIRNITHFVCRLSTIDFVIW